MIIEYTYVINLDHRIDRWNNIQKAFKYTPLKLNRWNAVYGKNLSDDDIYKITNTFCYYFCAPGLIGCWLSHYLLWKYIFENKLDNVLILEDDAIPIQNFSIKLDNILKQIPTDYDIVFLGCDGSCDSENNYLAQLIYGKNKSVDVNNKINDLVVPTFPLGMHAYIVSHRGAKKLLEIKELNKISYHIDYHLSKYIYSNKNYNIKMYATILPLIVQDADKNISDIAEKEHPIVNELFSRIKVTNSHNLDYMTNLSVIDIRKLSLPITNYLIVLIVLSFFIGLLGNVFIIKLYSCIIILFYLAEQLISTKININLLVSELSSIFLFLFLGKIFGQLIFK